MGYFVAIGIVVLLVGIVSAVILAGGLRAEVVDETTGRRVTRTYTAAPLMGTLVVGGVLVVLITLISSYEQVNAGHVGLVYRFGEIVGETEDGPQFIAPWMSLREVNVQVQRAPFHGDPSGDGDSKIEHGESFGRVAAASSETQNVNFDVTINWQLDRGKVRNLYEQVGPNFVAALIPSRVQQFFKAEIVKYDAVAVTQNREKIREAVTAALDREFEPYGISVLSVQIDNISYNPAFEEAIEQKQVATQEALRAQEVVALREAEARQNIAAARGDAEAQVIRAQGSAQANREIASSLTPELIQLQAIEKLKGTQIAILPSNSNFLLDPATLLRAP